VGGSKHSLQLRTPLVCGFSPASHGDMERGKAAFVALGCNYCHEFRVSLPIHTRTTL